VLTLIILSASFHILLILTLIILLVLVLVLVLVLTPKIVFKKIDKQNILYYNYNRKPNVIMSANDMFQLLDSY
jgi:uncharacterized membrane protein YqiK